VKGLVKFVNEYLMPAVRKVQPDIQIMAYDDQLTNLTNAAMQLVESTKDNINGVAFHWYTSLESIYENDQPHVIFPGFGLPIVGGGAGVKTLYDAFNDRTFLLMTESCSGYSLGTDFVGPRHGSFDYAYNTAHDLLWNVRNRAAGYVYWNLVLDSLGGPNLAGNYVDSPMYATSNGEAVIMNPSFFTWHTFLGPSRQVRSPFRPTLSVGPAAASVVSLLRLGRQTTTSSWL
jgi:O-glycosyl hydrolase